MIVVASTNLSPRTRGRLSALLVEIRPGVFIGNYSRKTRESIQEFLRLSVESGSAVIAWTDNSTDIGFGCESFGESEYRPINVDGVTLFAFQGRK